MALVKFTATAISGKKLVGTTQSIVVNAKQMFDWQDLTSGSRFRYVLNPNDRREKALLITVSEAISAKLASANTAFADILVKLPVEASVGATVVDRYVPAESIVWGEAVGSETDHAYVQYAIGGSKISEVMIPFGLNDLCYVSTTGTSSS